jgi:hypothetical protein
VAALPELELEQLATSATTDSPTASLPINPSLFTGVLLSVGRQTTPVGTLARGRRIADSSLT